MGSAVSRSGGLALPKKNKLRGLLKAIRDDSPESIAHAERVLEEHPEYLLRRVPAYTVVSTTLWHVAAAQRTRGAQLISLLEATLHSWIKNLALKDSTALMAALHLSSQPSSTKQHVWSGLALLSEHHADTAAALSTFSAYGAGGRGGRVTGGGAATSSTASLSPQREQQRAQQEQLQQPQRQQQAEEVLRAVMVAILDGRNARGQTPLMVAASCGCAAALRVLLAMGADPLAVDCRGERSALHLAARAGHTECVELLLVAAQRSAEGHVDTPTASGLTPLHYAAYGGYVAVAELLLRHGANLAPTTTGVQYDTSPDEPGATPLHISAWRGDLAMARLLLSCQLERTITRDPRRCPTDPRVAKTRAGERPVAPLERERRCSNPRLLQLLTPSNALTELLPDVAAAAAARMASVAAAAMAGGSGSTGFGEAGGSAAGRGASVVPPLQLLAAAALSAGLMDSLARGAAGTAAAAAATAAASTAGGASAAASPADHKKGPLPPAEDGVGGCSGECRSSDSTSVAAASASAGAAPRRAASRGVLTAVPEPSSSRAHDWLDAELRCGSTSRASPVTEAATAGTAAAPLSERPASTAAAAKGAPTVAAATEPSTVAAAAMEAAASVQASARSVTGSSSVAATAVPSFARHSDPVYLHTTAAVGLRGMWSSSRDVCGVCLDAACVVRSSACGHQLCFSCAQQLSTQVLRKVQPLACPFCRQRVPRFESLPAPAAKQQGELHMTAA